MSTEEQASARPAGYLSLTPAPGDPTIALPLQPKGNFYQLVQQDRERPAAQSDQVRATQSQSSANPAG